MVPCWLTPSIFFIFPPITIVSVCLPHEISSQILSGLQNLWLFSLFRGKQFSGGRLFIILDFINSPPPFCLVAEGVLGRRGVSVMIDIVMVERISQIGRFHSFS